MGSEFILELQCISKSYRTPHHRSTPLKNVTANVANGDFIIITGPSGTGKSTLFRLLTRLEEPDEGQILYLGKPLFEWHPPELRQKLHYVFQAPVLFPGTVADNLSYSARLKGNTLQTEEMEDLLRRVALPQNYISRRIEELSGGEKQRVNIARSLSLAPDVLLLDEPTSALDEKSAKHIESEIKAYHEAGHTVLWITHSPEQAKRLGSILWRLKDGLLETELVP
ncbi:ABC transporter ATP-binding protein [Aneurinibacillus aneurinilyticus]|nr:ATP-binding cassette domain-containing protein [Aneurinibacillus aneurinilyticus]MCI1693752.1 ATP-binding cassette domain-containing protein [Aneurinibacillus aneurinilyticus]MED0709075.1 ATP-binding cassette domain-containing protein [Aneurinibacillus aneurinilyticus]MED0725469.1 ATP-binding cassette domain-containing protein [Aneurinibacillus aneurinilyticus]MED0730780.1 ATP-binding cassette domain-containing protein [Aneurinibacillus aneurinilyticus]MED0740876.1 ATP-binding cassette doma